MYLGTVLRLGERLWREYVGEKLRFSADFLRFGQIMLSYIRIEPTLRRKQQKLCMKQKTLLIAMLAIVMAACGDKQQEVAPQAYPVVAVEQSAVEITDDYPATIRGRQDIEIYPQVSGKIVEVAVAQARASKLSVKASVLTLKKQIRAQENSLSALLGRMSGHIERSTGSSSPRSLPWECRCNCSTADPTCAKPRLRWHRRSTTRMQRVRHSTRA